MWKAVDAIRGDVSDHYREQSNLSPDFYFLSNNIIFDPTS